MNAHSRCVFAGRLDLFLYGESPSSARRPEDVLSAAEAALAERPGPAVAAVLR